MAARALMFQGTGSDVGKSLIVAALARAFADRGHKVRPFKPQNMSNNAAVTADSGEIGRAQALQARAARTAPSVHMNPVLLKPQSDVGAQIVVQGRVHGTAKAADYQLMKASLMPFVLESFARLKTEADIILVEGAGSASEVNLRANDIANMGFARAADVPVVLIGDIDRGGVIASLVGTKAVIDAHDAALVCGFLVNKFRGDPALFADGMTAIARATGWEALGLVPFFADARLLPAEDALALDRASPKKPHARIRVAVPILPHIANFDDLDPLEAEPAVELVRVRPGAALPGDADLVILPGSKATTVDLAVLRQAGFHIDIAAHLRRGGAVLGLCGGYQMLGRTINDPAGIEGAAGTAEGLGLLVGNGAGLLLQRILLPQNVYRVVDHVNLFQQVGPTGLLKRQIVDLRRAARADLEWYRRVVEGRAQRTGDRLHLRDAVGVEDRLGDALQQDHVGGIA